MLYLLLLLELLHLATLYGALVLNMILMLLNDVDYLLEIRSSIIIMVQTSCQEVFDTTVW